MEKRLENICESLMELFQKEKRIDEEQVYIFLEGAVDFLNREADEHKTVKLDKLGAYLQKKWQYREIEQMTPEQAFLCGSIWGGAKLLGIKRERKETVFEFHELKKKHSVHYDLLHAISVDPGIKHKDLAGKLKKSTSHLSQYVIDVIRDGLITCSRIGREKYYYLSPLGEQVYDELKKEKLEGQKVRERITMEIWTVKRPKGARRNANLSEVHGIFREGTYGVKEKTFKIAGENSNYYVPIRPIKEVLEDNNELLVKV